MSDRCAPADRAGASGRSSFADFVTDNAANGCATDCSEHTAPRKNGASDGTDASANGGVLTLRRHAGASTEGQHYCCGNCTERDFLRLFHGIISFLNVVLLLLRTCWSTIDGHDMSRHP
jgi:hypothetical protein